MSQELFRREVLEAQGERQLGEIFIGRPLRLWALSWFGAVAAASIICFLSLGEYSRRSRVVGQLVPSMGLSSVVAPAAGVVGRVFREEGDTVVAGDALVWIKMATSTASGQDTMAVLRREWIERKESVDRFDAAQLAQLDTQIEATRRQLEATQHELRQIRAAVATRDQQVLIARRTLDRYRRIIASNFVSQAQVDQQELALLELIDQRQATERQATQIQINLAAIEQSLRELPEQRRALEAAAQRDRTLLNQERVHQEASGEVLIKAPVAGSITNRLIAHGDSVHAGQPLLMLLPDGSELLAQLMVPSRAIGFVSPGDSVRLRYQAFPYQKFGHYRGRVQRVSRSAIQTPASSEPHYRVLVALDTQTVRAYGKQEPLLPGMAVEADILGEKRKLYEWLLEPLYSLTGAAGS